MADPNPTAGLTGGCMCEQVRFSISEPLPAALYCYCKRCQRRTGTGFSVSAIAPVGSFRITSGPASVATYGPGDDGWHKSFCRHCGSQLFTNHPENEELIAVRLGALDQDPGVRPSVHQFTAYAAPWAPVPDDDLPHFPERMTWSGA